MAAGPGKEHGANKPPPTGRVQERSKGDSTCRTTSQNPSRWRPSWLSGACTNRKDSESDWLRRPGNESHDHKTWVCEPRGRTVLRGRLTLLLSARLLLPSKIFCFVSTCISSDNSFLSVRPELHLGPGKGPPSWNNYISSTSDHQALDPGCWGICILE